MADDILLPFDRPAVSRKRLTADFAGGLVSSDEDLVLTRAANRRLGVEFNLRPQRQQRTLQGSISVHAPESKHTKALSFELILGYSISFSEALDFRCPKRPIRSRNMSALRAAVPETSINEDGNTSFWKHKVKTAQDALGAGSTNLVHQRGQSPTGIAVQLSCCRGSAPEP